MSVRSVCSLSPSLPPSHHLNEELLTSSLPPSLTPHRHELRCGLDRGELVYARLATLVDPRQALLAVAGLAETDGHHDDLDALEASWDPLLTGPLPDTL